MQKFLYWKLQDKQEKQDKVRIEFVFDVFNFIVTTLAINFNI